ncbi:hypothetical protein GEMRC1_004841 [Eukaryota sp. GEM-RC1]
MREFAFSTNQHEFIKSAVLAGIRHDGRTPQKLRNPVHLTVKSTMCECVIGETHVVSSATLDIVTPFPDRPQEGQVLFSTSYSSLATPDNSLIDDSSLNRAVERVFRETQCIEPEALCITAGKRVWKLSISTTVLNHSGNSLDCCVLSIASLLSHFKVPAVFVDDTGNYVVQDPTLQPPVALPLFHLPISVSLVVIEKVILVDPNREEEVVADSHIHIVVNRSNEICVLSSKGEPLTKEMLSEAVTVAFNVSRQFYDLIETAKVIEQPLKSSTVIPMEDEELDLES